MKAMILAAGRGTRLRPLTDDRPKALVEIAGRTLLELTIERLREFGVDEVIINVHHHASRMIDYLAAKKNFGIRIEVSPEPDLLDTGGGLKKASWFFLDDPRRLDEPFVLHNVDVLSTIDLERMIGFHTRRGALATLAVQDRHSSRYLIFDPDDRLCGRRDVAADRTDLVRPAENPAMLAFSGIHVVSPRLFEWIRTEGAFSIVDAYLDVAARGARIAGFRADEYSWRDLGKPESLELARKEFGRGRV